MSCFPLLLSASFLDLSACDTHTPSRTQSLSPLGQPPFSPHPTLSLTHTYTPANPTGVAARQGADLNGATGGRGAAARGGRGAAARGGRGRRAGMIARRMGQKKNQPEETSRFLMNPDQTECHILESDIVHLVCVAVSRRGRSAVHVCQSSVGQGGGGGWLFVFVA